MRVGIDATSWSNARGYGRFLRGLLPALADAGGYDLVAFIDAPTARRARLPETLRKVEIDTGRAPTETARHAGQRSLSELRAFSRAVSREPLDVFVFPTVYTFAPVRTGATVIVGIHDVIPELFPELVFPRRWNRLLWRLKIRLSLRQAAYVLTVSEHAKRGIERVHRVPAERIWVVDEAADPIFRPMAKGSLDHGLLARHGVDGERFLIYLGGVNPHKNLGSLVDAVAELRRRPGLERLRLLVVGEVDADAFTPGIEPVRARIDAAGLDEAVRFTGFVADRDVVHLLAAADALVLPSLAEGFGLPAVEAAACGTPVVATRESPLPELLAGGGLFVDPRDRQALLDALAKLLGDDDARRDMGRVAAERAGRLSWPRSARQFLDHLARLEPAGRGSD